MVLQGIFFTAHDIFEGVETDLVLLNIRIHEDERLHTIVDAVTDKVEIEKHLLTEDVAEVRLRQQHVKEGIVLAH